MIKSKYEKQILFVLSFILIILAYGIQLYLLPVRKFDIDEFEHLHAAWYVHKGFILYKDFFEHHTPGLYFFLAPFFIFFDVETNSDQAFLMFTFARILMWIFLGCILILIFRLGNLWQEWRVGLIGTVFVTSNVFTKNIRS
ncbi:MAG: hypothetical protein AB4057_14240 [Crocosphaera sp.]